MQSFWTVIGLGFVTSLCGCGSDIFGFDVPELEPPLRAATPSGLLANTRAAPNEVDLVIDRFYHPDGSILGFIEQIDDRLAEFEERSQDQEWPCLSTPSVEFGFETSLPGGDSPTAPMQCMEFADGGEALTTGDDTCSDPNSECGLRLAFGIDSANPSRFGVAELSIYNEGGTTLMATAETNDTGTSVDLAQIAYGNGDPADPLNPDVAWIVRMKGVENESLEFSYGGLHWGEMECGVHAISDIPNNLFYLEGIFSAPWGESSDKHGVIKNFTDASFCELKKQPDGTTPEFVQLCMNADDLTERDLSDCTDSGVGPDSFELPVYYADELDIDTMKAWTHLHWNGIDAVPGPE